MENSEYMEMVKETVKYKMELIHFKKLLGEVKSVIQIAIEHEPDLKYHFSRIMESLEANGVKGRFDAGCEYDAYLRGNK